MLIPALPAAAADPDPSALYSGSYALLIGASDYTAGWPDLESIPGELEDVEAALRERGFTVVKHMDPDSEALEAAFENFIDTYGLSPENRLLFLFAGHGHTRLDGRKGYLVPTDAPDPHRDDRGFVRKALSLTQVMAWARRIESRHALFLFDSCFSGTVFKTRDLTAPPPVISELTQEPVRYFITAGKAGEPVPAQSVFTPALVDAIRFGTADLNQDGYVTGTELGLHLRNEVPKFAPQTPQFGPILDYELSRGDFVLAIAQPRRAPVATPKPPAPVRFTGHVQINTDRTAEVFVDDKPVGVSEPGAPLNLPNLPVGTYAVRAVAKSGHSHSRSVTVVRGQWSQVVMELTAPAPPPPVAKLDTAPPPPPAARPAPTPKPAAQPVPAAGNRRIRILAYGMPLDDGSARTRVVSEYSQQLADMLAQRLQRRLPGDTIDAFAVEQSVGFDATTDNNEGRDRRRLCAEFSVDQLVTLYMEHQYVGGGIGYSPAREPVIDTFDCNKVATYRKTYQVSEKRGEQTPFATDLLETFERYLQGNPLL